MSTYQAFPALDAATEAALRASIERFGVLVPVVRDQHDNTLDGHQRERIASELGVPCDTRTIFVDDDAHAREIARTLNEDRRHLLDIDQRRQVVQALASERDPDDPEVCVHSQAAIADALGITQAQVSKDESQLITRNELDPAPKVRGKDGIVRPIKAKPALLTFTTTFEIRHSATSAEDAHAYAERMATRLRTPAVTSVNYTTEETS